MRVAVLQCAMTRSDGGGGLLWPELMMDTRSRSCADNGALSSDLSVFSTLAKYRVTTGIQVTSVGLNNFRGRAWEPTEVKSQ
jgi:hypothetical protein